MPRQRLNSQAGHKRGIGVLVHLHINAEEPGRIYHFQRCVYLAPIGLAFDLWCDNQRNVSAYGNIERLPHRLYQRIAFVAEVSSVQSAVAGNNLAKRLVRFPLQTTRECTQVRRRSPRAGCHGGVQFDLHFAHLCCRRRPICLPHNACAGCRAPLAEQCYCPILATQSDPDVR